MVGGREVAHVGDVRLPGEVRRELGAPDDEAVAWRPAGGLQQQGVQRRLAVLRVRAQEGEIPRKSGDGRGGAVRARIDAAVKRSRAPCAQAAELVEGLATRVAQ